MKTLYIAGPMTGYPQFNVPLFDAVAKALRDAGHYIVSPAEMDSDAVRAAALASPDGKLDPESKIAGESWGEILARDVRVIADGVVVGGGSIVHEGETVVSTEIRNPIDGIALLPGWSNSRGARLEVFVGLLTGKAFYTIHAQPDGTYEVQPEFVGWIRAKMAEQWADDIAMYAPVARVLP